MASTEYQVVPFIGRVRSGVFSVENADTVAAQLQEVIDESVADGWEFYRIDQVQIVVSPGCLGLLFGRRSEVISFDQVIFRRPAS